MLTKKNKGLKNRPFSEGPNPDMMMVKREFGLGKRRNKFSNFQIVLKICI
jgi:hypothetical protein